MNWKKARVLRYLAIRNWRSSSNYEYKNRGHIYPLCVFYRADDVEQNRELLRFILEKEIIKLRPQATVKK